ncbi:internal virion protein [Vibrio phage vB_VpP_NS8]|nr:internal virion protein [Vibrio phage vB_VpP_NS8]
MPIQSNPLQLGAATGNLLIGAASPRMENVQAEPDASGALIAGFLQTAVPAVERAYNQAAADAAIQGALDATATTDAMSKQDEKLSKVNMLFKESYQSGYLSAAVNQEMGKFRQEQIDQVNNAVSQGKDLEYFDKLSQERNAAFASQMSKYLPHIPKQSAMALLQDLQETSVAARNKFQKDSAAMATVVADRALDSNLDGTVAEFYSFVDSGAPEMAQASIAKGLRSINLSTHLSKDDKIQRATAYVQTVAQRTDEPSVINMLQGVVDKEMGVLSPTVIKALRTEYNRAGNQQAAQAMVSFETDINGLAALTPDEQAAELTRLRNFVDDKAQQGIIEAGTAGSYVKRLNEAEKKARQANTFQLALNNAIPSTVLAGQLGMDLDKTRKELEKNFPDTAQGNLAMMAYASQANDSYMASLAAKRMSTNTGQVLATIDFTGKDNVVSEEQQAQVATWMMMYSKSTAIGKQTMLQSLPENLRGPMGNAALQNPENASNILFDDLRRNAQAIASGKYNAQNATMPNALIDGTKLNNWLDFGTESDRQVTAGATAVAQSWKYIAQKRPELTNDLDAMEKAAYADARTRQVELQVNGDNIHTYVPVGKKLDDFYGAYKGSQETFVKAMNNQVASVLSSIQTDVSGVTVDIGAAGGDAMGMVVAVEDSDGIVTRYSISGSTLQQAATTMYADEVKTAAGLGSQQSGLTAATFYDATNNRAVTMNVTGVNKSGIDPFVFGKLTANLMESEGFLGKKKKAGGGETVGFGRHTNSGKDIADEVTLPQAIGMLKGDLEDTYIPMVKSAAKSAGLELSDAAYPVLVDLAYHGGGGSANPVAKAMADYAKGVNQFDNLTNRMLVMNAMMQTPAYKQSGKTRQEKLRTDLTSWLQQNQPAKNPYPTYY